MLRREREREMGGRIANIACIAHRIQRYIARGEKSGWRAACLPWSQDISWPFQVLQQIRGAKSDSLVEDGKYECWEPEDVEVMPPSSMKVVTKRASLKTLLKKKPHKSFRLRTEKYMRPFMLDVFVSKRFINASIMHRVTSRVIACASTNSKEFRPNPSRTDLVACKTIGEYLAERAKEADCFTAMYVPRVGQTPLVQGRIAAVVKSVADHGITLFHGEKGITLNC